VSRGSPQQSMLSATIRSSGITESEMAKKSTGIVTGYARMWPREIFDVKNGKGSLAGGVSFLEEKGLYIPYRDEHPYYIGKTSNSLFKRLRSHALRPESRYYNFWNLFSAFAVPDRKGRDKLEGILIAAMPTVNSAKPKLIGMKFPPEVSELAKEMRASKVRTAGKRKGS
jgi:hypothetical protein